MADALPAIYTTSAQGTGQGAILIAGNSITSRPRPIGRVSVDLLLRPRSRRERASQWTTRTFLSSFRHHDREANRHDWGSHRFRRQLFRAGSRRNWALPCERAIAERSAFRKRGPSADSARKRYFEHCHYRSSVKCATANQEASIWRLFAPQLRPFWLGPTI